MRKENLNSRDHRVHGLKSTRVDGLLGGRSFNVEDQSSIHAIREPSKAAKVQMVRYIRRVSALKQFGHF